MPGRSSIATRVLVPVLLLAALTVAGMVVVASRTTSRVREDYDRLAVSAAAAHVTSILDLALSELTAARLQDNPTVVGAKKQTVIGSLRAFWDRSGLEGVLIGGDGAPADTTLPPELTGAVVREHRAGYFAVDVAGERLHAFAERFPVWDWTVVTVGRSALASAAPSEVRYLLPLLALGTLALALGVLLVFWRNLRIPVARMVADVQAGREARPTGLAELDGIGDAVNWAVARLQVRTGELASELERRRQAERALQENEARVRLLLDSTAEGILGIDVDGNCTFSNPAAQRMLGYPAAAELLGQDVHRAIHRTRADGTHFPEEDCPVRRACREGTTARVTDEVFWRKDGTRFPVEYWSYPIREGGAVRGTVLGFLDITERAGLEQQLRQSQKMEALGRLAGGIAHDFNNILMAVIGNVTLARDAVEEGSEVRSDLDEALVAAEKATALTRQILAFSRRRSLSLAPVDLNETVLAMGKVMARLLGEDVEVVFRLAGDELVVMADRVQLEQVLLNLWTNARDAMPSGGRLVVGSRAVSVDADEAARLGLEEAGRCALLAVEDSGVGMDEATRLHVFEPFFTTKAQGKGTGLGLAIVYGIVRQHRGQITVASAPGKGATFTVHLPLAAEGVRRPAPDPQPAPAGGSETLLVAEDNDQVRALARSVLERAGYRVLAARDGVEALALHEAHADEIALCLFDVVMPRLGGREALDAVRQRRPTVRALLMSGYAPDRGGADPPDVPILAKPFVPLELLRRVREALDA